MGGWASVQPRASSPPTHQPTARSCIAACRPGATMRHLHQHSVALLSQGLASLGVLPGRGGADISGGAYRAFYPHSVGHWLGLDTHDSSTIAHDQPLEEGESCVCVCGGGRLGARVGGARGALGCPAALQPPPSNAPPPPPGVVLTIEPGLYIPDDPAYRHLAGIGVRIEDDVAITGGGRGVGGVQANGCGQRRGTHACKRAATRLPAPPSQPAHPPPPTPNRPPLSPPAEGHEVLSAAVPVDPGEVEAMVGTAAAASGA